MGVLGKLGTSLSTSTLLLRRVNFVAITYNITMASFGTYKLREGIETSADYIIVFVTGNANKLKEVKAILAAGDSGIEVTSKAVDGKSAILESLANT